MERLTFAPLKEYPAIMFSRRIIPLLLCLLIAGGRVAAQAVPDTSLNSGVVPDSLADRKAAELEERTKVKVIEESAASTGQAKDNIIIKKGAFQPNPKKSALFSAILPGSGQLYNRQYWKTGLIYAGVGVAGYFLVDNTQKYRKYRKAYVERLSNPNYQDEFTGLWSPDQTVTNLQTLQNTYKKYLDLTYLLTGVGYVLQVIDALAFAHLKNFDISQDLSMRLQPVTTPNGGAGLGLVVHFK